MSEEGRRPSGEMGGDAAGAALALGAASREKADRYLDEQVKVAQAQTEFLHLQSEDLRQEERLRRRSLRLHHVSETMKVAFELSLALFALTVIVMVGAALWSAAHDDGLVIESFSVPPDMLARGLTGDVVAARLLDKLAKLQAQTASARAASSYANNWGGDIKVQIPDTGVSIGQLYDYLTQWLGHQTHISGEITHNAAGTISVTARVGADGSPDFTGSEADFDKLLQQAAEAVYGKTQPYRYAVYLSNRGRNAESEAAYRALIATGSPNDRAWAYVGLSTIYQGRGDIYGAITLLRTSLEVRPDFNMAYQNLSTQESSLQHDEATYQITRKLVEMDKSSGDADMDRRAIALNTLGDLASLANSLGDFQAQIGYTRQAWHQPDFGGLTENLRESDLAAYAFLHDGAGLDAAVAALPATRNDNVLLNRRAAMMSADYVMGRWAAMRTEVAQLSIALAKFGKLGDPFRLRVLDPLAAGAAAANGDFAAANARIANAPLDCDLCTRIRGRIAALEHRWDAANHWYAMLSARDPSIPFPDSEWGAMLLAKGDAAGAIAKFRNANQKGPHFADPLEMWGEALMLQNRSDLALAKFMDADQYAPHWGRLHLKWGEALVYAGKPDEAKKQFAIASGLDLSAADRAELARRR
jgi:tetratricopeptide (TPR) repeat protein